VRHIQIGTTSLCPGHCKHCPHDSSFVGRAGEHMSNGVFNVVLRRIRASHIELGKVALYLQAEPFADPQIVERADRVYQALTFSHLELSTNCALLSKRRLASLLDMVGQSRKLDVLLSFPGTTQESYNAVTPMDYHNALKNLERFLAETDGYHNITRQIQCCGVQGAAQFWAPRFKALKQPPLLSVFPPVSRAGNVNPDIAVRGWRGGKGFLGCPRLRQWIHINWLGEVISCCHDYNHEAVIGSLLDRSLDDIIASIPSRMAQLAEGNPNFLCYRCETLG